MSTFDAPNLGQELPSSRRRRERNPVTWIIIGLVLLVLLYSCGRGAYSAYRTADTGTDHFHQLLNQGQYEEIYGDATDDFRKNGSRGETLAFLEKVHQTMGDERQAKIKNFNVNHVNGRTLVTLIYWTKFAQGEADEQFVWLVDGDTAKLYGYHVNNLPKVQ